MKKTLTSIITLSSAILLVGCSSNSDKNSTSKNSTETSSSKNKGSQSSTNPEKVKKQKFDFKNSTIETTEFTIKITKHKLIEPGKEGNKNGKKPVLAFWYEVTSKTGNKSVDPITAWQAVFNAEQSSEKGENKKLKIAALPDEKYSQSQMKVIAKGKTVKNATAYELDNNKKPVTLTSIKGPFGEGSGQEVFTLK